MAAALVAAAAAVPAMAQEKPFDYHVDRFADIEVLRYKVPDFENLTLNQKLLVYYLTEAAINGRDILWDQNGELNLQLRPVLETIYVNYKDDRNAADFKNFETYLKQVWFGNGIHHHYSTDKFVPKFPRAFFEEQFKANNLGDEAKMNLLAEAIFNPTLYAKRVNQADGQDLIRTSANNLYDNTVTQKEVEDYYAALKDTTDLTPISYGLNARVAKVDGKVVEQRYKLGGLYSDAIAKIMENLLRAREYAENPAQKDIIDKLVEFYGSGDLKTFDD